MRGLSSSECFGCFGAIDAADRERIQAQATINRRIRADANDGSSYHVPLPVETIVPSYHSSKSQEKKNGNAVPTPRPHLGNPGSNHASLVVLAARAGTPGYQLAGSVAVDHLLRLVGNPHVCQATARTEKANEKK